ncbi:MAG: S-4TM family putative pore-forming effector [Actinomycetota bacterium]|nr:S-4TM family putative pore-forming effector [Actinomycetota bacterium]
MTSSISERQQEEKALDLVCAANWHYRRAKAWHFVRVLGTICLALLAPIVTFWVPSIATPLATAAAAWVFVARVALARWEDNQVRLGATAQEQFDCHVFGLPWHEALAGRPLATQDVLAAARRVKPTKREELRNWYSPKADMAPWPLNAVLCQSASATWSRRAHEHYARVLLVS